MQGQSPALPALPLPTILTATSEKGKTSLKVEHKKKKVCRGAHVQSLPQKIQTAV